LRALAGVYLAGQLTGVEGYVESAACGLYLGLMLAARLGDRTFQPAPATTALGALLGHLRRDDRRFQPSNVTWSMFPPLDNPRLKKRAKREALAERALKDLDGWLASVRG
jgi:methylenetetrahydrofolate--tRNA-(uracil-5-)-methyltransferase